jgi:pyruvate/2-oxoglutarate dehydrogenase complex dihydrolipoamide acyltransferase (E2) component
LIAVPIVSVRIPQMGEGLQEALLVEFIKKPGDAVRRDEPIYVMETDKATTEVESPYTGTLVAWTVQEGTVLAIGTEVAQMEVNEGVVEAQVSHGPPNSSTVNSAKLVQSFANASAADDLSENDSTASTTSGAMIPPRTRKYIKEKGLLDVIDKIPAQGNKLMPEDVDRYLAVHGLPGTSLDRHDAEHVAEAFDETPLPKQQITLNYRLVRGAQVTVPVTVMTEVDWSAIDQARKQIKEMGGGESSFTMMLWCVAQALRRHPKFRSSLVHEGRTLRTFRHVNFGIAVALPGDMLTTAVVKSADTMSRSEFNETVARQIEMARMGKDQADATTTISVSNIGSSGMRWGVAAVVSPAVATLALGEVFDAPVPTVSGFAFRKKANLTLAFDHRVINGIGAGDFMNDIKREIESFSL